MLKMFVFGVQVTCPALPSGCGQSMQWLLWWAVHAMAALALSGLHTSYYLPCCHLCDPFFAYFYYFIGKVSRPGCWRFEGNVRTTEII